MATSITYGSTTTGGKSLSKSIADVNPNVSNSVIKEFTSRLNALTTNTLGSINRVDKTEIDPEVVYRDIDFNINISNSSSGVQDGNTVTFPMSALPDTSDLSDMIYVNITPKVNNISFMPTDIVISGRIGVDGAYINMDDTTINVTLGQPSYVEELTTDQTLTITVPLTATVGTTVYHSNPVTFTFTVTGTY